MSLKRIVVCEDERHERLLWDEPFSVRLFKETYYGFKLKVGEQKPPVLLQLQLGADEAMMGQNAQGTRVVNLDLYYSNSAIIKQPDA